MDLTDGLLISTLESLRESVDGVRVKQDTLQDSLHNAVLQNTKGLLALESRVASIEHRLKTMRKHALRGLFTSAAAIATAVARYLWAKP